MKCRENAFIRNRNRWKNGSNLLVSEHLQKQGILFRETYGAVTSLIFTWERKLHFLHLTNSCKLLKCNMALFLSGLGEG